MSEDFVARHERVVPIFEATALRVATEVFADPDATTALTVDQRSGGKFKENFRAELKAALSALDETTKWWMSMEYGWILNDVTSAVNRYRESTSDADDAAKAEARAQYKRDLDAAVTKAIASAKERIARTIRRGEHGIIVRPER